MTYKPEGGDYVRVVLEGYVRPHSHKWVPGDLFKIEFNGRITGGIEVKADYVKKIEKIEKPLKPGDLCRFWDYNSNVVRFGFLKTIDYNFPDAYYEDGNSLRWDYAERVPEPLASQLKELYFDSE